MLARDLSYNGASAIRHLSDSGKMTFKIVTTDKGGNPFEFSTSSVSSAASAWANARKKDTGIANSLQLIKSGDYLLVNLTYTYSRSGSYLDIVRQDLTWWPGRNELIRRHEMYVTSDEYPYSVINNATVCVLSKSQPPTFKTTGKSFYLAKVFFMYKGSISLYNEVHMHWFKTSKPDCDNTTLKYEFMKLCDAYDNDLVTMATLCNALSATDDTATISIASPTKFTYYFAFHQYLNYFPMIYTETADHTNVFTPDYFTNDACAFTKRSRTGYGGTHEQTITLGTSGKSVTLTHRYKFMDGSKDKVDTITFSPLARPPVTPLNVSPVANAPVFSNKLTSLVPNEVADIPDESDNGASNSSNSAGNDTGNLSNSAGNGTNNPSNSAGNGTSSAGTSDVTDDADDDIADDADDNIMDESDGAGNSSDSANGSSDSANGSSDGNWTISFVVICALFAILIISLIFYALKRKESAHTQTVRVVAANQG